MKIIIYKSGGALKPSTADDSDKLNRLKPDIPYSVSVKEERNYEFHKKYFKLINVAWELLGEKTHDFFKTSDSFRKTIEISAGWYEVIYNMARNGWLQVPKSIAFDKMSQEEFEELYERVKDVIWMLLDERDLITIDNFNNILKDF